MIRSPKNFTFPHNTFRDSFYFPFISAFPSN